MTKYNKDIHNCKCDNCEKGMRRTPYEIRSGKGLYCSRECNNEGKSKKAYNEMCEKVGYDFKQWLDIKYNVEKMNSRDLAELAYGKRKNGPNITNWMKKLGVSVRERSEAVELQWVDNEERRINQSITTKRVWGVGSESRAKLKVTMKSKEYREKQSISKTGEKNGMFGKIGTSNPRWNPDLTMKDRIDRRAINENIVWRKSVLKRDDYICKCCKYKRGGCLVAHHLNGYHWDIENRFVIDNGITLCESCHKDFHKQYGYGNNTKEQFNEYLNLALVP